MSDLDQALERCSTGLGSWDPSWRIGRRIYGGLVAAALSQQMERRLQQPERVLRSITFHFCASAEPGRIRGEARSLREGVYLTHLQAALHQAGGCVAFGSACFALPRPHRITLASEGPGAITPPERCPLVPPDLAGAPEFTRHFRYRWAGGGFPWSAAPEARMSVWIEPASPSRPSPHHLLAIMDAAPPAVTALDSGPRQLATVDWRVQLHAQRVRRWSQSPRPYPVLLQLESTEAAEGYAGESSSLWSREGDCLAQGEQLIAVLSEAAPGED